MKNRIETENKLLKAVTETVLEYGIKGVGVNRVASRAGCSKMLIYRYFDSFDGLLQRWAEDNNYWIRKGGELEIEELRNASPAEKKKIAVEVLTGQLNEVRTNRIMREILRWQIGDENELCTRMMAMAEERGVTLTRALAENSKTATDTEAFIALITAGIFYLTLSADYAPVYNGVDLESEEGWGRIESVIEFLIDILFRDSEENYQDS